MGAIVISNYVARSGKHCQIDAAIAISGGLDMRENLRFKRSIRLWQPMLAQGIYYSAGIKLVICFILI